MKIIILLLYPVAKPIALFLDMALGEELSTLHTKEELGKLLEIHVREGAVDSQTGKALQGTLRFKDVCVEEAMTKVDKVFMVSNQDKLSYKTMASIFKVGRRHL